MRIRWNSDRCEVSRCFRQCGLCRGPPRLRPRFEQPGLAKPSEVGGGSTLSARLRTGKRPQGCWPRPSGSSPAPPLRSPLRSSSRLSAALRQARPPARPCPLSRLASRRVPAARGRAHRLSLCSSQRGLPGVALPVLGPLPLLGSVLAKAAGLSRGSPRAPGPRGASSRVQRRNLARLVLSPEDGRF